MLSLCRKVQKLKHSRDKLLEEIDSQWEEMDRLANEQKATAAEAATQRQLATTWEAQAQDALVQVGLDGVGMGCMSCCRRGGMGLGSGWNELSALVQVGWDGIVRCRSPQVCRLLDVNQSDFCILHRAG